MTEQKRLKHSFKAAEVAAFRLTRHHLVDRNQANLVTVCQDVCGIQAQVMSAAEMALKARMRDPTRTDINSALWERRALVKTSCMRGTLHLLAATDFPIYMTALKASRIRQSLAIMARYGVTQEDAYGVREAAMEALLTGPTARRELTERVLTKTKVGKKARTWFEQSSWGVARLAITEGLVCYGPDRGREVAMVRVDQWLPSQKQVSENTAQKILLRRYLSAYGPATLHDFSKWAGLSVPEGEAMGELLVDELAEVVVEGRKGWVLRADYDQLGNRAFEGPVVRLLAHFDPYLLAHVEKDHLVETRHYKRVYRNQGWISPVVLLNGRVIGTWSYAREGQRWTLNVEPFEVFSKTVRTKIEEEAESLARFLETTWEIKYNP